MSQVLKLAAGIALGLILGFLGIQAMMGAELRAALQSRPPIIAPVAAAPTTAPPETPAINPYDQCRHGQVGQDKTLTVDQWIALDFQCAEREHIQSFGH